MIKVGEHITLDIIGTDKEYDPSVYEKVINENEENVLRYINPHDIRSYGLIPEIIGRLPVMCHLNPLTKDALRDIMTGIGGKNNAPIRQTGFDIVTASEIMAILALSSNLEDLRYRLGKIIVGVDKKGTPINANQIEAVGSMMALLRQAINPNIVQTSEGQPVIVHTGPFGNIAQAIVPEPRPSFGLLLLRSEHQTGQQRHSCYAGNWPAQLWEGARYSK